MRFYAYLMILLAGFMLLSYACTSPAKQQPHNVRTSSRAQHDTSLSYALKQENILLKYADAVQKAAEANADDDGLMVTAKENELIKNMLKIFSDQRTFSYNFPRLKNFNIGLVYSNDQHLKIYYWQSLYSGTMWHVQNILQLNTGQKIIVASFNNLYQQPDDDGPTPFISKAYHLANTPMPRYLLLCYGQMSGIEPYEAAHVLDVENGHFNINKKSFLVNYKPDNELYIAANVLEDQDADKIREAMHIKYDSTNKTLTYPVIKETAKGNMLTGQTYMLKYNKAMFR